MQNHESKKPLIQHHFKVYFSSETPVFPLGIAALRRRNPGENLVAGSIPLKGQILIHLNRLLNF